MKNHVIRVYVRQGPPCYDNVKFSWMPYMSHASYLAFFRDVVELNGEGMNELNYGSIHGGYSIWNLRVAHADPMS